MSRKKDVDEGLIRTLAALLDETGLTEIEIAQNDMRVRVARQPPPAPLVAPAPPQPQTAAALASAREEIAPRALDPAHHPGAVKSPMVGTAYRAPEPGARPLTEVGEAVVEGQAVMIVEAMKTMNQIVAPRAGVVTAILVDDGQPVEYGEPLMIVE